MNQNMSTKCLLCSYKAQVKSDVRKYRSEYFCNNCGKFSTENLGTTDAVILAKLSHAVKKGQRDEYVVEITNDFISEVSKRELPTVVEQVDNLVLYFGKNSLPGKLLCFSPKTCLALLGSVDEAGFNYILKSSIDDFKYLLHSDSYLPQEDSLNPDDRKFLLSRSGWIRYEELRTVQSHKAFMAMDFKNPTLDKIFNDYFIPAVKETGFDLERVDTNPKAGLIDDKIRVDIRNSRFVIADLTDDNRGAYWEAGYAEGLGKQVIYTCKKEVFDAPATKPHFDTNHHLIIVWEVDKLEEVAKRLKATIRATLPDEAKMTDDE